MGFKKGRAARAAKAEGSHGGALSLSTNRACDLEHDAESCVMYTACNGCRYSVDVATMQQTNLESGNTKDVFRHQGHVKNWIMWQYEAQRQGKSYRQPRARVQYPKEVCFLLEQRWKAVYDRRRSGSDVAPKQLEVWRARTRVLKDKDLRAIFDLDSDDGVASMTTLSLDHAASGAANAAVSPDAANAAVAESVEVVADAAGAVATDCCGELPAARVSDAEGQHGAARARGACLSHDADAPEDAAICVAEATIFVGEDEALRELLLERALRSHWHPSDVVHAIRWLMERGLKPTSVHCRKAALLSGSLMVIRVFIMEARVDVRGMELLPESFNAEMKQALAASGSSGWVQRSKPALKALIARGAVVGNLGVRSSKLLRRIEEDGEMLWVNRAVESIACSQPAVPEPVLQRIREFCFTSAGRD